MFLCLERQHLQEAWAQMHKFHMAAIFQRCSDAAKHSDCTVILWSADKLFILTTWTKKRYIAKATNSQYLVNTIHSHLLKKASFYLHLIGELI